MRKKYGLFEGEDFDKFLEKVFSDKDGKPLPLPEPLFKVGGTVELLVNWRFNARRGFGYQTCYFPMGVRAEVVEIRDTEPAIKIKIVTFDFEVSNWIDSKHIIQLDAEDM